MSFRLQTSAALAIATILVGCSNTTPPVAQLPPLTDCGASELQDQVGQPVRGASASDATVDGIPVRSKGDVRVIAPGQAVIQNYSEDRLNLETDASGNLVRASCG
ncbi:I78 family peptidase inhibitor (plasmid) [Devosia neptuniae]|uniref:I78 family peptidase inhibitor n=1 Tax=Devosia neptuniae TaxID=191302 RepID=A0ABY6C7J0_9HYPH|nr:I78 family peptidase inhibitor [Devosia neptuniae]UXN68176.1 I78 family peptidase inhibitor [Devosia neptuniae]